MQVLCAPKKASRPSALTQEHSVTNTCTFVGFFLQDAVMRLSEDMCRASFPVIELLGLFKLTETQHIWLYGSSGVVGKPGRREFAPLRKLTQAWPSPGEKVRLQGFDGWL